MSKSKQPDALEPELTAPDQPQASLDSVLKQSTSLNPPDPFDNLDRLCLSQDFLLSAGVKKHYDTIPVDKPHKQDFIRVNPDPAYQGIFSLIDMKAGNDKGYYLVTPEFAPQIPKEWNPYQLFIAMNRQDVLFVWPVKLTKPGDKENDWNLSQLTAAVEAMKLWKRVQANMNLGAYERASAQAQYPAPEWPDLSFNEILRVAFRKKLISDFEHPLIKRLLGL